MIGIVTVLYNSENVLPDFFRTLGTQSYQDFKLYAVDNVSSDRSVQEFNRLSKTVSFPCLLLEQPQNYGVAKGNNIGIEAALSDNCDYILLANNDVYLENEAIEELLNGLQNTMATMAISKIYFWETDKMIWSAGGYYSFWQCDSPHRGKYEHDKGQYDKMEYVPYGPTCFMLIKNEVFSRVGMMDEKYFVYFDDGDFVWRACHKLGEKLLYCPKSVLWHKVSSSTGGHGTPFTIYYLQRNRIYFTLKNYPCYRLCFLACYLIVDFASALKKYDRKRILCFLKAIKDGFKLYRTTVSV